MPRSLTADIIRQCKNNDAWQVLFWLPEEPCSIPLLSKDSTSLPPRVHLRVLTFFHYITYSGFTHLHAGACLTLFQSLSTHRFFFQLSYTLLLSWYVRLQTGEIHWLRHLCLNRQKEWRAVFVPRQRSDTLSSLLVFVREITYLAPHRCCSAPCTEGWELLEGTAWSCLSPDPPRLLPGT